MNYSTAIFLINKDVRAIRASYEVDANGKPLAQHVKIFKTLDKDIKPGDHVVVPTDTRHNLTCCRVEEVDVDIDFDSTTEVKWIVQRVDGEGFKRLQDQENEAIRTIRSAEVRRKRDDLAAALMIDNPDLKMLPIVSAQDAASLPAPPAEAGL